MGLGVGDEVGVVVGYLVGVASVGKDVGSSVGFREGSLVGESVGIHSTPSSQQLPKQLHPIQEPLGIGVDATSPTH